MRVQISVQVYDGGFSWNQLAEQKVEVEAPLETLDVLDWDLFCASLVLPALMGAREAQIRANESEGAADEQ